MDEDNSPKRARGIASAFSERREMLTLIVRGLEAFALALWSLDHIVQCVCKAAT